LIIKRHKLIIAFWVVVLICCLPFLRLVKDVIVYEETDVSPLSTGSQMSQRIIDEEFPKLLPECNAVIVVQADDVRSADMRDFMLELEERTANGTDKLPTVTETLTVYSTYRTMVLEPAIVRVSPLLYEGEDQVDEAVDLLFDLPSQYYINYSQLDLEDLDADFQRAAGEVYYFPSEFVSEWGSTQGDWRTRTQEAYNLTIAEYKGTEGGGIIPPPFPISYLVTFVHAWNATWEGNQSFPSDAARAQAAVATAAPVYYDFYESIPEEKLDKYDALRSLSISNWSESEPKHHGSVFYQNNLAMLRAWAEIEPRIDPFQTIAMGNYVTGFLSAYNGSFWHTDTASLDSKARAEYAMDVAVPPLIDDFNFDNQTKELIEEALDTFTLDNWKDPSVRHDFMLDSVVKLAEKNFDVTVPKWFLEDIYDLGPNATEEQAAVLASTIVKSRTLDQYPVPIPSQISTNFIDSRNRTMLAVVGFGTDPAAPETERDFVSLRRIVEGLVDSKLQWGDYRTYTTGEDALDYDMRSSAERDTRMIEPFTAILVVLFIALYFRSAVAPWVPLLAVGMAFVMAQGLMFLIGNALDGIHYSIRLVVFTMIMGAGADYCIIIVSRFREERIKGRSKEDAITTAVVWAGESITTSGATAIVAFLALAIFSFPLVRMMGLCLASAISVMLVIALTLIPSLLYLIGDWVFWPTMGKRWKKYRKAMRDRQRMRKGYFFKAAKASLKYSWAIVIGALLISVPTTYLVMDLEPSYDFLGAMPEVEGKIGVERMSEGFGAGKILPTYVVVSFYEPLYNPENGTFNGAGLNATDDLVEKLSTDDRVRSVTSSAYSTQSGLRIDLSKNWTDQELQRSLGRLNRTVMLTVVLEDEPSSVKAVHTVQDLRGDCADFKDGSLAMQGSDLYLGGSTIGTADIGTTITEDFPISIAIVMVGVYLILLFVLGSVLIPLRLMLTILLSISWTLALALMVFIWWLGIPVLWILPILLFVILMGLGMDYDIFLMTRIKEEVVKGKDEKKAIAHAVEYTGSIITICGVIMASAFGTMMISTNGLLREFGFGLCFAILIDAMVVRIFLVPAIMILLRKWNWWAPFGLQKVNRKV
jgi:RND superfamily putative drug exporter